MEDDTLTNSQKYILYLQLAPKISEYYLHFSQQFSQYKIQLVPVMADQLKQFSQLSVHNLMIITHDVSSIQKLQALRRKFLDFALSNGRYRFFYLTSFSDDFLKGRTKKNVSYYLFRLPCESDKVVEVIAKAVYSEQHEQLQWPGRNKVRLPHF